MEDLAKLLDEAETVRGTSEWTTAHEEQYQLLVAEFKAMETSEKPSGTNLKDEVVKNIDNKITTIIADLDRFTEEHGEETVFAAFGEFLGGKTVDILIPLVERYGGGLLDAFIIWCTWSRKAAKYLPLPKKIKVGLMVLMISALGGAGIIEGGLTSLAKSKYISKETSDFVNTYGLSPLEKLNPRKRLVEAVFDLKNTTIGLIANTVAPSSFGISKKLENYMKNGAANKGLISLSDLPQKSKH